MTIDEAIKDCEEVANDNAGGLYNALVKDYNRQVAKWLRELKEAKRLLKLAIEDLEDMRTCLTEPYARLCGSKWRYADEAESLIRDIEDGTNDN